MAKALISQALSADAFSANDSMYHFYNDVYPHFIKNVPVPVDGYVTAPDAPGLGSEVREEPFRHGDTVVETIAEL